MKKVYIIGAGHIDIERVREITSTPMNVEIIRVDRFEDIPLTEQIKSDHSVIQQIHEFKAQPLLPEITRFHDKKKKGHERPYKFHK